MKLSPPSSEKRFWPTYLVCRKRSRPSAAVRRFRMCFFFSCVKFGVERIDSSFSFHQRFCSGSLMYMYSAPIVPQYVSRSALTISRSDACSKPKYRFVAHERLVHVGFGEVVERGFELGDMRDVRGASADRDWPIASRGTDMRRSATGRRPAFARWQDLRRRLPSRGMKALAFARWANDSTIGPWATSLAFVPSEAGTFCNASK